MKYQRTCVACRQIKDKRNLIRMVRAPMGQVVIDLTQVAEGRGAYLCRQVNCWQKGLQKERLARALKTTISAKNMTILQDYQQMDFLK